MQKLKLETTHSAKSQHVLEKQQEQVDQRPTLKWCFTQRRETWPCFFLHGIRIIRLAEDIPSGKLTWLLNIAIEIVDLPIKIVIFHSFLYVSKGNIPIFRKSSHTMFSSYSRPGFWYVTLIGISAQSGGNSWPTANPLNAPPQLSIPYVVPKELWTLNELKAALIRKFPHLSTEEGQGCQR